MNTGSGTEHGLYMYDMKQPRSQWPPGLFQ